MARVLDIRPRQGSVVSARLVIPPARQYIQVTGLIEGTELLRIALNLSVMLERTEDDITWTPWAGFVWRAPSSTAGYDAFSLLKVQQPPSMETAVPPSSSVAMRVVLTIPTQMRVGLDVTVL